MNLNSTGVSMLLKAMGFDPELLAAKASELEQIGKMAALQLQAGVQSIETRLASIEASLIALHNKIDAHNGETAYAGESSVHLLEAPPPQIEKEPKHNGR